MKRYDVFVSSTYRDLKDERNIVRKALINKGCFPVAMEEFPATDQEQFEYIKKIMKNVDYYILIMGGFIGTIPYNGKKSYIMMEYEYALELGIPIIVFIKLGEDKEPLSLERGKDERALYDEFLRKVQAGRIRKGFNDKHELSGMVYEALDYEIALHPRSGWRREYDPEFIGDKNLLLRGKLFSHVVFRNEIYDKEDNFLELISGQECDDKYEIKYGIDTQGAFKLILFNNNVTINFYHEVDREYFDYDTDMLKENVKMQITFAKMGNIDEILLFFSVGDGYEMTTKVYRMSNIDIKLIGKVEGQEFMYIDYSLNVPIGSQGMYEEYFYHNGTIYHMIDDVEVVRATEAIG